MIEKWEYQKMNLDFSSMFFGSDHPSDIDMFYIGRNQTLIVGEVKNERGRLKDGQRKLLAALVEGWKYDAIAIFIQHNKYHQRGDRTVNVIDSRVTEIYSKGEMKWRQPTKYTIVRDVLDFYKEEE